jgi:hypothetical protein
MLSATASMGENASPSPARHWSRLGVELTRRTSALVAGLVRQDEMARIMSLKGNKMMQRWAAGIRPLEAHIDEPAAELADAAVTSEDFEAEHLLSACTAASLTVSAAPW